MKKKKVLILAWESLVKGGIQSVIMSIVRGLSNGYVFDIVLFTDEVGSYETEFLGYGGSVFRVPRYNGNNSLLMRGDIYLRAVPHYYKIRKIIRDNGPYWAIHTNNCFESGIFLKAASKEKIPIRIIQQHSVMDDDGLLRVTYNKIMRKLIEKYATFRTGVSRSACISIYGEKCEYSVIYNTYDDSKYYYLQKERTNNNCIVLTQVGRLSILKNQLFSLQILNNILSCGIDAVLVLVGEDYYGYKAELVEYIEINGLKNRVKFYNSDCDIPSIYKNTDYCLLPSRTEGFGIVLVEAQACGVHCFASNNVPIETNCGGCNYISLDSGSSVWSDAIVENYKHSHGEHVYYDCSRFSSKEILCSYKKMYENEL